MNNRVLEKLHLYLNSDRVLLAAGYDPKTLNTEEEIAHEKRNKRVKKTKGVKNDLMK